jgi:hypothetical protein
MKLPDSNFFEVDLDIKLPWLELPTSLSVYEEMVAYYIDCYITYHA